MKPLRVLGAKCDGADTALPSDSFRYPFTERIKEPWNHSFETWDLGVTASLRLYEGMVRHFKCTSALGVPFSILHRRRCPAILSERQSDFVDFAPGHSRRMASRRWVFKEQGGTRCFSSSVQGAERSLNLVRTELDSSDKGHSDTVSGVEGPAAGADRISYGRVARREERVIS
jgi:hypothetical protein